jgi:TRAP-type C4-dicarboxylate transport system substrate-binding protein
MALRAIRRYSMWNKEAFNKLPEDLQLLIKNTLDKWTIAEHEYLVAESIKALDDFKKAGCEVYKLQCIYLSS